MQDLEKNIFVPTIPCYITKTPNKLNSYLAVTIICLLFFGAVYLMRAPVLLYYCILPFFIIAIISTQNEMKKMPQIYLDKSYFKITYEKKSAIEGVYKDYEFFIDEAPKKFSAPSGGVSYNNYRYRLSLRKRIGRAEEFVVLYPSFLTPKKMHEVIDAINANIEEPMPLVFNIEKLAQDYQSSKSA